VLRVSGLLCAKTQPVKRMNWGGAEVADALQSWLTVEVAGTPVAMTREEFAYAFASRQTDAVVDADYAKFWLIRSAQGVSRCSLARAKSSPPFGPSLWNCRRG
jgi:hypothetical protein